MCCSGRERLDSLSGARIQTAHRSYLGFVLKYRILIRHILPNIMAPAIIHFSLNVPAAILNWRQRGSLLPEVSGAFWTTRFIDIGEDRVYGINHI